MKARFTFVAVGMNVAVSASGTFCRLPEKPACPASQGPLLPTRDPRSVEATGLFRGALICVPI
jgi:hypothetical protein